jgi:hypothetical protein
LCKFTRKISKFTWFKCVFFTRVVKNLHSKQVTKHKFTRFFLTVCVILDSSLSISYVKAIGSKRVIIMKCVSNVRWGVDQDYPLRIHQMLVLSTLEYGSSAYASATLRNLKTLYVVQWKHHVWGWIHNPITPPWTTNSKLSSSNDVHQKPSD